LFFVVCVCSVVRRSHLLLSLFTDDVWSNEKSDYERAKRERVEQQNSERGREENLFSPKKRESEHEEIAKYIPALNSGIYRTRKRE
jgi:hypothetical protein